MEIDKLRYQGLREVERYFMKFEDIFNIIGVETRNIDDECIDEFRQFNDVINDVVTVLENNPSILSDALNKKFYYTDEVEEFQSHYNLSGIVRSIRRIK